MARIIILCFKYKNSIFYYIKYSYVYFNRFKENIYI